MRCSCIMIYSLLMALYELIRDDAHVLTVTMLADYWREPF
jgi:hypothetical protein